MALTPPGLTAALTTGLISGLQLGIGVPQLATGLANGTLLWSQAATVISVDSGSLGVGAGVAPLIVPQPLLLTGLFAGIAGAGMTGPMAPLMATGLANGFFLGFSQAQLITVHPIIGVGAGVAKISAPAALPFMIQGLTAAGMSGQGVIQISTVVSIAFGIVFASLGVPIVITGTASPTAGAGAGTGKIV